MLTRVFKSGNSLAVRIPKELAFEESVQEVEIERVGNAAASAYGVLRNAVPDRRRNALDRLIAAHAIAAGAVLVTNNEADFRDYPGADGRKLGLSRA